MEKFSMFRKTKLFSTLAASVAFWLATLPANAATTLVGPIQPSTAPANQWITGLGSNGILTASQPAFANLTGQATLSQLPSMATNTVLANATSAAAVPTALAVPSCSGASNALTWTTNTGFGCNSITLSSSLTTSSKTANYTVLTGDNGTYFDNIGASATVVFTLPAPAVGLHYCFTVAAAQTITVTAATGSSIAIAGINSAAAGNISSSSQYSSDCFYANGTTQWMTYSTVGTWTVT
jgi:hypothetical protein